MRCFFMQAGHIAAAELPDNALEDDAVVRQSRALFVSRIRVGFDGFEVWNRARRICRHPEADEYGAFSPGTGGGHPAGSTRR